LYETIFEIQENGCEILAHILIDSVTSTCKCYIKAIVSLLKKHISGTKIAQIHSTLIFSDY